MSDTRRRAFIAVVLGLLVTGLGHAYLREWRRALAWLLFVLGASVVLSVTAAVPADATLSEWPLAALLFVLLLQAASVFDAYNVANRGRSRSRQSDPEKETCPHCGREVDGEMDFCWYCAESLERGDVGESSDDHLHRFEG